MFAAILNKKAAPGGQASLQAPSKQSKWDKILSGMKQKDSEVDQKQERFENLLLMFQHLEPAIEWEDHMHVTGALPLKQESEKENGDQEKSEVSLGSDEIGVSSCDTHRSEPLKDPSSPGSPKKSKLLQQQYHNPLKLEDLEDDEESPPKELESEIEEDTKEQYKSQRASLQQQQVANKLKACKSEELLDIQLKAERNESSKSGLNSSEAQDDVGILVETQDEKGGGLSNLASKRLMAKQFQKGPKEEQQDETLPSLKVITNKKSKSSRIGKFRQSTGESHTFSEDSIKMQKQGTSGEKGDTKNKLARTGTFYQQKTKLKSDVKLNESDMEVIKQLKGRLIDYMHLSTVQQKGLLQSIKASREEPQQQASSLDSSRRYQRKKRSSQAVDQLHSDRAFESEHPSDQDAVFLTSFNQDLGAVTHRAKTRPAKDHLGQSKSQPKIEDFQMNMIDKLKFIQGITGKTTLLAKKRQMIKQLDKLVDGNKQKELYLQQLQNQLIQFKQERKREIETTKKVKQEMEEKMIEFESPKKLYKERIHEQIYDIKSQKQTFDYTNIDSMIEKKEVLLTKLKILEPRMEEQVRQHSQYTQMLAQLYQKNRVDDSRNRARVHRKTSNVDGILNQLADLQMVENTRALQIENMVYKYRKRMEEDEKEMEKMLEDRTFLLQNEQTEVQDIIYRLLDHMRQIKRLIAQVTKLEGKKESNFNKEKQIIEAYKLREDQISMITKMSVLSEIQMYWEKLDRVQLDVELSEDLIRLKGLELISDLKYKIKQIQTPPKFQQADSDVQTDTIVSRGCRFPGRTGIKAFSNKQVSPKVQLTKHQELLQEIENYVENKQQYDQYYKNENQKIEDLEFNFILEIYLTANIKLNSLREAHQSHANEKESKLLTVLSLNEYLIKLKNEKQSIGDYIKRMDEGATFTSVKGPLSVEGMQIYIEEINTNKHTKVKLIKILNDHCSYFQHGIHNLIAQIIYKFRYLKENVPISGADVDELFNVPYLAELFEIYQQQGAKRPHQKKTGPRKSSKGCFASASKRKGPKPQSAEKARDHPESQKTSLASESANEEEASEVERAFKSQSHKSPIRKSSATTAFKMVGFQQSGSDEDSTGKPHPCLNLQNLQDPRMLHNFQDFQQNLYNHMITIITYLRDSRSKLLASMPLLKKTSIRRRTIALQNQGTLDPEKVNTCTLGAVNIEDFDPIFRRKDFKHIKSGVLHQLNLKKSYSLQQFRQMKQEAKQRMERIPTPDYEQVEFAKLDPREKKVDQDALKNAQIRLKLNKLREYKVKESLWRKDLAPTDIQKHRLNRQRHKLSELPRQEQRFMDTLKDKIEGRYDRLKKSFIREYRLKPDKSTAKTDAHQQSQEFDFSVVKNLKLKEKEDPHTESNILKSSLIVSLALSLGSQINKEKVYLDEVKQAELDQYIKPITSPCFGKNQNKAPISSSLRERIKLNKKLTQSKEGGTLGVKTSRKKLNNEEKQVKDKIDEIIYQPGMTKINNRLLSGGGQMQQRLTTIVSGKSAQSSMVGRGQIRPQINLNLKNQPYTSNQGYNLTYRTMDTKTALLAPQFTITQQPLTHRGQKPSGYMSLRGSEAKNSFNPESISTQLNSKVDLFNKFFSKRGSSLSGSQTIYNQKLSNKLRPNKSAAHVGVSRPTKRIAIRQNLKGSDKNEIGSGHQSSARTYDKANVNASAPVSAREKNPNRNISSVKSLSVVDLEGT